MYPYVNSKNNQCPAWSRVQLVSLCVLIKENGFPVELCFA